jgi:hypothetical protein
MRHFAATIVLGVALSGGSALAAGYWNMPGTSSQRCGCGYGPGYHAPLVLGPVGCDGWSGPHVVRMPCAVNPYGCCYGCSACGDCGADFGEPSTLEGHVAPSAPVVEPVPAEVPEARLPRHHAEVIVTQPAVAPQEWTAPEATQQPAPTAVQPPMPPAQVLREAPAAGLFVAPVQL